MKHYIQIIILAFLMVNCKDKIVINEVEKPVLLVSSKNLNIEANENSTVTFDVASNIDWTTSSNQTWLKINTDKGKGSSTLTLTATANPAGSARTASVIVSGTGVTAQTITVTQTGIIPFLNVSTNTLNLDATANSTANFDISSNQAWTLQISESWLTANVNSGTANAGLILTGTENDSYSTRIANVQVMVNGVVVQTIIVTQKAKQPTTNPKPNWTAITTEFQYTMTFVAKVSLQNAVLPVEDGDELAAFVGTECRGKGVIVTNNGTPATTKSFYLMVKGNPGSDIVTFKYYQSSTSHIYDLSLIKNFVANFTVGSPDEPYKFEVK
jgi:hypothetical protein